MMNQFAAAAVLLVMEEVFVVMEDVVALKNMRYIAQLIRPDTRSQSAVGFAGNQIVNAYHFNYHRQRLPITKDWRSYAMNKEYKALFFDLMLIFLGIWALVELYPF